MPLGSAKRLGPPPSATVPAEGRDSLLDLVEQAIAATSHRKLTVGVHTPWQIVHGVVALRWDCRLRMGSGQEDVSAIEWLASCPKFEGEPLWQGTEYGGRGHPFTRPYAFEGHPTQFLGYMTMADIPLEYEIQTPTKVITIRDIINDAKKTIHEGPEITWTLWTLAHYESPDAQWNNYAGEAWSIERLVKIQTDEQVTQGACGGCHGLFALAYARNRYLQTGRPLQGVWIEADQKLKRYIEAAKSLQNSDGTFSANHFQGPGYSTDFTKRISTTGHQLEWLLIALPHSKLKEPWLRRGVQAMATDLLNNQATPADCGPLFHSLHSLVFYRQRMMPNYAAPKCNSPLKIAERSITRAKKAIQPAGAESEDDPLSLVRPVELEKGGDGSSPGK